MNRDAEFISDFRKIAKWFLGRIYASDHACLRGSCDHARESQCVTQLYKDFLEDRDNAQT